MSTVILSRSFRHSKILLVPRLFLHPSLHTTRAASLNSAIGRGIRRSQNVGSVRKGKADGRDEGPPAPFRRHTKISPSGLATGGHSRDAWRNDSRRTPDRSVTSRDALQRLQRGRDGKPPSRSSQQSEPLRLRIGKRVFENGKEVAQEQTSQEQSGRSSDRREGTSRDHLADDRVPRSNSHKYGEGPDWEHQRISSGNKSRGFGSQREPTRRDSPRYQENQHKWDHGGTPKSVVRTASEGIRDYKDRSSYSQKDDDTSSGSPRVIKSNDKRTPLSITYTTPASEFLYGTSVVEAALKSEKNPRRKHYKLYIYTGEKRENNQRDSELERLAFKSGVKVSRVGGIEWLTLLDKMSGGRPHNGYILEASPLPRLPVTSLKEFAESDNGSGFKVVLDYQSREDAAINGTSDFIKIAKGNSGRKPLVLFVDSILDPGNLGGIIRTASFLGATAVAISKNCTAFSPVVLKASAGSSENITLFTVNKPAGFIAESKKAGWKIYAAVAPTSPHDRSLTFTDDLADPLSDDPCILMLGAEGEGLRQNLRTKADVHLSIRGSKQNLQVDSLNVSVATGILCTAFFRKRNNATRVTPPAQEELPDLDFSENPIQNEARAEKNKLAMF